LALKLESETSPVTTPQARDLVRRHGSPLYIYQRGILDRRAETLASLKLPFGFTPRYAVKANPHPEIIQLFHQRGLHFDASSSYEATMLLAQGIPGPHISLSSQQPAADLDQLIAAGVQLTATSLHQLDLIARAAPTGHRIGLRLNPGVGDGHNRRTTTAGVGASFGLWHEYLEQALDLAHRHHLVVDRLHTHIGSGADPRIWQAAMDTALTLAERMPDVTVLDIGGGYKVARMPGEADTDLPAVADVFAERLQSFADRTGRRLHLEMEPGTWLVAAAGSLITEISDIVDTGAEGYTFLRVNTGMNDILRPTLYGAQHRLYVLGDHEGHEDYVVVGHNCESGDILTTAPHEPEQIEPRRLQRARIGDLLLIADTGAYCASLRAQGYNAFPSAGEVLI
jgi:diaminopimelate decarboxylase